MEFGYETALPQLVSRYVVNRACFGGDSDRIDSETASPVLVLGCVGALRRIQSSLLSRYS